jgi:hypothetical protein
MYNIGNVPKENLEENMFGIGASIEESSCAFVIGEPYLFKRSFAFYVHV